MPAKFRMQALAPWFLAALAALFGIKQLDNSDTWWHLASGRWMVENWSIPSKDVLSFTVPGHDWINLQWLFDLLMYLVYQIGEAGALVLFSAAVYTAMFVIMIVQLRRSLGPLGATAVAAWVLHICQDRFVVRPEMFSFLLLQLLLWLLATARQSAGKRLWLLVPLMALWVNCHSLFIIGLFCIGCAVIAALLADYVPLARAWSTGSRFEPAARKRLLIYAGLSLVAVLANPYFIRGALFPFKLMTRFGASSPFISIGEFSPSFTIWFPDLIMGSYQALLLFSLAVVLLALLLTAFRRNGRDSRFDLADLFIFAGLGYLSLLANRNMALFALGIAPLLGRCLVTIRPRGRPGSAPAKTIASLAAISLIVVAGWLVTTNRYYHWDGRLHLFGTSVFEANFPVHAARFIDELDLPGPLYNDMTPGGYLAWSRPQGEKVFIDGRLEVYDDFFVRYQAGLRDPKLWAAQAEEFGINSVLLFHVWSNRHPLIDWLNRNPAWSMVYFDEVAVIFVRASGNEGSIAGARGAFQSWYDGTLERLERPPPAWSRPIGRIAAWESYAALFETLGDRQRAQECYESARQLQ
jgi:hypothetical protein